MRYNHEHGCGFVSIGGFDNFLFRIYTTVFCIHTINFSLVIFIIYFHLLFVDIVRILSIYGPVCRSHSN